MKRIKLIVAYDGTNYCGWQIQPNGITIEEVLNHHLSQLLKEPIKVIGASRTDSGVHALGNVAVFDTKARMPGEKISLAMNTRLPMDIRIVDSCEVEGDFHPRFCETVKTYEYRIYNHRFANPLERLYSLFYYNPLDVEEMQKGASYLVGEHDFAGLCTKKPEVTNTVRRIDSVEVKRDGDLITIRVIGNGFLYNMVRIIAGTLLRIGSGYYDARQMQRILETKDRSVAGETARPEGLRLVSIYYKTKSDI